MKPASPLAAAVLLLASLTALGGPSGTLEVHVEGDLDSAAVDRLVQEIRLAEDNGVDLVLLEIDVASAPGAAGLELAKTVEGLTKRVRTVALIKGRAPGSALAVAFACAEIHATKEATLGPIPDEGPVRATVARQCRERELSHATFTRLLEADGVGADAAAGAGLVDSVLESRAELRWKLELDAEGAVAPGDGPRIAQAPGGRRTVRGRSERPFLLPFDRAIDDTLRASVERRIEEAKAAGADLIILEVDSPGGTVDASMKVGDLLFGLDIPVVMLVLKRAISGAALVSLAGDEIVMGEGGVIGDCQPIAISPGGYQVLGEKIQSPLRATFRKYAVRNGYSTQLAEGMITEQLAVERVTFADGKVLFLYPEEVEVAKEDHGEAVRRQPVLREGELLTMEATKARDFGFCGRLVANRAEALSRYGISEANLTILEETWAEQVSRFLLNIKFLLFIVGIMALYMELKAPGFGIPGAVALLCFALFFSASAIAGIATGIEVVLFLLGVGLLALELLVIPGFGIPGIAGVGMILVSLYMASVKYGLPSPDRPWEIEGFFDWLLKFGGAIIVSIFGILVLARLLPKTGIGRRIILAPAGPPGSQGLTGSGGVSTKLRSALLGKAGRALTDLRPAGRIEVEGEPHDAVTQGDFIDEGEAIEVLEVKGNRIVVRKA
jgi:membrane-bound serine protease (ClpP class)